MEFRSRDTSLLFLPDLNARRTMTALRINAKWVAGGETDVNKRIPLLEGEIDLFKSNKATKEDIDDYIKLVWEDTDFGTDIPCYFKVFDTAPNNKAALDQLRNAQRLTYLMLGHQLWNSLSSAFKHH